MKRQTSLTSIGQLDLILNLLVGITAAFVIAFLQINPPVEKKQQENILPPDGVFVIVAVWPDASPDDVDLYVQDPGGNSAYFQSRDVGLMHYEHDDLGDRSDRVMSPTGEVLIRKNEERVILRGVVPGEYVVNVHMYHKAATGQTPVTVVLYQITGQGREVIRRERVLERDGDEKTAFRFRLTEGGDVAGTNELPKRLTGGTAARLPGGLVP